MGIVKCFMCDEQPYCNVFFVWSSDRYFPKEELIKQKKITSKIDRKNIYSGVQVCFDCLRKLKEKNK